MKILKSLFPFLRWFPMSKDTLRSDSIAGITVALVLVPQSMAYAQLAGLPVVYGLYAAFIPVIVASLWGSSNQLHTGPVAMLSLMSAAALIPFATPETPDFIELSIMLALMVGVLRLALGLFKLGAIVNLLSSPVIVGFTNAAALIIGMSQLSKIIGVPFPRSDSYLNDLWVVLTQLSEIHWATLAFAAGTWLLMAGLKRISPSIPAVLIAVAVATMVSAFTNYEDKQNFDISQINDDKAAQAIGEYDKNRTNIARLTEKVALIGREVQQFESAGGLANITKAEQLRAQSASIGYEIKLLKVQNNDLRVELNRIKFEAITVADAVTLYRSDNIPANAASDNKTWRFSNLVEDKAEFSAGGAVVGDIPKGLPSFNVPVVHMDLLLALLPAALVMALIGFMEATSISKAIATDTGERVDTGKELIGQGVANIAGSFFGSYTVSGSFSRSAVAARTGAKTGLFAIISATAVVLVLLFFTEYLYHLPQSVLAVIVMMAVFSLIRIQPLTDAWKFDRIGSLIGILTFFTTLYMAPSIADGILLGIGLTIVDYLIRTMKPRTDILSRKADGTLGGIKANQLEPISEYYVPVRFDGSLTFVNVAYFEDMILEAHSRFPKAKTILIVGSGINEIDASGEEKIREIFTRLDENDVHLAFSGLKNQVMRVFSKSGLEDELGEGAFFKNKETAMQALTNCYDCDPADCSQVVSARATS